MIRKFHRNDLSTVMQIWLDTNIRAHSFIPRKYWMDNFEMVKNMMQKAELYVHEDDNTHQANGFIGLTDDYIAGIFVRENVQSDGIGKQLMDYVKKRRTNLCLSVYQKNIRAVRFYQRESFVIQSENYDEDTREKEFVMVWKRDGS